MNKKLKRSVAVILTAAAVWSPFSSTCVFPNIGNAPVVVSAAGSSDFTSGYSNNWFYEENKEQGYTLYYSVTDWNKKEAVVSGCTTKKDSVWLTIPDKVKYQGVEYNVTEIGENSFRGQDRITSMTTSRYIDKVGNFAFADCSNLQYITWSAINGNGDLLLTDIGNKAFMNCVNMWSTSFMRNVRNVGEYAFYNCGSISEIYANDLESIGEYSFAGCYSLYNVDFSQTSITEIPDYAFQYSFSSSSEPKLQLPESISKIGNYAFYNVNSLTEIDLENVTKIGTSAFENCHNLKNVFTGEKLSSIGAKAFYGCDPMTYFVCKNPNASFGPYSVGYANTRNYSGKKSNFTLWSTKGGGKVKSYAASTGITYKNTEDAAKDVVKRYEPYMWSTGNSKKAFGDANGNYYIAAEHKPYVDKDIPTKEFSGTCFGMATVSALVCNGYLSVDQFASGYNKISDISENCPAFIKSFVNSVWSNYSGKPDFKLSHSGKGARFTEKDRKMLRYIEYITYGADVAVACYSENSKTPGHAIDCLGMEFKENASDKDTNKQWNGMDARILFYDGNWSKYDNVSCMYVNFETGEWTKGVQFGLGTKAPAYYKSDYDTSFVFELFYKPNSMINRSTSEGKLYGMDLINKLLSVKH